MKADLRSARCQLFLDLLVLVVGFFFLKEDDRTESSNEKRRKNGKNGVNKSVESHARTKTFETLQQEETKR